jgi:nicotinamide riboside kinase
LKINEAGGNTTQLLIMNEHIKNLLYQNVIMDRCVLDGVVYTDWLHWEGKVQTWVWEYAKNVFDHYVNRYDVIFYLKPEFDIVDDGVRSVDISFRDEIVQRFERYIKHVRVPIVTLSGTVEQRLEQFYNTLEQYEQ